MSIPERLRDSTVKAMLKHAEKEYPRESCGVVVISPDGVEKYVRCKNIAKDKSEEFVLCPDSYVAAEEKGEVVGIVHSHPDWTTKPSDHDIAVMSVNHELQLSIDPTSKLIPWHIVSWPEGDYRQVDPCVPTSLLGLPFVHSVWDCWALCEAYYIKYHGISFPPFERKDLWWEDKDGPSLYEDFYEGAGFYQVSKPEVGDMMIMQIGRTCHPNHAGIYLGEAGEFEGQKFVGSTLMLHHLYGKKSEVIVYGGQWQQRTRLILRHKDMGRNE